MISISKALDRIDRARKSKDDPRFEGEHSTESYSTFDIKHYSRAKETTHQVD